ncbi:MAG: anti-sigma factor family protein [Flammeovirgaceae bacterium]
MDTKHDERLMNYVDGLLSASERERLEKELQSSPVLRERLEVFRLVSQELGKNELQSPSRDFTTNVLSNLDRKPMVNGVSPRNGLLLFAGVLVAVLVVALLLGRGMYDSELTVPLSEVKFPNIKQTLPSVNISNKMIVNGILIVAVAISFLVLDRTVLKPLFQKRMHQF